VAGTALVGHRHLAVVPLGRLPAGDVVAAHTVHGRGDVAGGLAGGGATVVAAGAVGRRREQAVVGLGAQPGRRALVAVLAHCLAVVDGRCRAPRHAIAGAGMAGGALAAHRDIGVELPRVPGTEPALVAAVTVADGHAAERCVGDMVGRLAVCRGIAARVAGTALVGYRRLAVVPLGRLPAGDVVAADAVHTGRDVGRCLARGGATVVAARAVGGAGEQAVVGLGAQPGCRALVAVLAHRLAVVDGRTGLACHAKGRAGVAGRALAAHRHVGVELPRVPGTEPALVTAVTVADGHPRERFVGNVIGRGTTGRREAARVAGGALVGHGHLAVVPVGRLPARHTVAAGAVRAGRHVGRCLTGCSTAVVTASAVGGAGEQAVVGLGAQPGCRALVAILTGCLAVVDGRAGLAGHAKGRARVAGGALAAHRHIGVELTWIPGAESALVAAVAIGDIHPRERLVGNVIGRGTTGRREAARVAACAPAGDRGLAVVPGTGLPAGGGMAAGAIEAGLDVRRGFSAGTTAVVTAGAIGCAGETTVIGFGTACPSAGRLVAVLTGGLAVVHRRAGFARHTKGRAGVAGRALAGDGDVGMELSGVPAPVAALVAAVAVGDGYARERLVGNVVGCRSAGRWEATRVAGTALARNRRLAVVPVGWFPPRHVVAADAVCAGRDVGRCLAHGGAAVVAAGAVGGAGEQAVVGLGTRRPHRGGAMAVLADRLTIVNGGARFGSDAKAAAGMAGGALPRNGNIGMELARIPTGVSALVAGVAIGNGDAGQALVRNVVRGRPVGRWKASGMARGALVGDGHLAVVPGAGLPAGNAVAAGAVGAGRQVGGGLARGGTAVVAAGAIGRAGGGAVVELGPGERHGGVTAFTPLGGGHMAGRLDHIGLGQAVAAGMAGGAITRCALEHARHMAGLAARVGMRARQRKAGLDVVEVACRTLCERRATGQPP